MLFDHFRDHVRTTNNRKEFWCNMKTLIATCCICIALTQQCLGDETLFTCTDPVGSAYVTEGGYDKPGWRGPDKTGPVVTKLIRLETPKHSLQSSTFVDIQKITTQNGVHSFLKDDPSCDIEEIYGDVPLFDQAFVGKCKSLVSTFLFYTRSGVTQLLETLVSFPNFSTAAGVSVWMTCKKGD